MKSKLGERNFMKIESEVHPSRTLFNLEYIINLDSHGTHKVKREGNILGSTEEEFQYSITGQIAIQPMQHDRLPEMHDDSCILVKYCLGEKHGVTVKPDLKNKISEFELPHDKIKDFTQHFFPYGIIEGRITVASEKQFPGDITRKDFASMFKEAVSSEMVQLMKAQEAFVNAYGGKIIQYGAKKPERC